MMKHVEDMVASATANIELGNEKLADGHDVTDGILDYMAEIESAIGEIATLTGEIEGDIALLHARGEEAYGHMANALASLGDVYALPEVPGLVNRCITARLHIQKVNGTLEGVQEVMAARPRRFFELMLAGVEAKTVSTVVARQDLKMAQESNNHAIGALKKYAKKV